MLKVRNLFNSRPPSALLRRDNFRDKFRLRRGKKFYFIASGVFILFVFLVYLPVFQIKKIIVIGAESEVESQNISRIIEKINAKNHLFIIPGSLIFFFNKAEAAKTIMNEYGKIDEVSFKFELPSTLAAAVKIQSTSAYFKFDEKIYELNRFGVIARQVAQVTPNSILLINSANLTAPRDDLLIIKPEQLQIIQKLKTDSERYNLYNIQYFDIAGLNEFTVKAFTDQGWYVLFNAREDTDLQISKLGLFLRDKLKEIRDLKNAFKYIDLRFGVNRVYYQ